MKKKFCLFGLLIALSVIVTACSVAAKPKQIAEKDLSGNTFKIVQVENEKNKNLMAKILSDGKMEAFVTFSKDGGMVYEVKAQEKFEKDKKVNQTITMFNTLYQGLSDEMKWSVKDGILETKTKETKAIFKGTLRDKKLKLVFQEGEGLLGSGTIHLEKQ